MELTGEMNPARRDHHEEKFNRDRFRRRQPAFDFCADSRAGRSEPAGAGPEEHGTGEEGQEDLKALEAQHHEDDRHCQHPSEVTVPPQRGQAKIPAHAVSPEKKASAYPPFSVGTSQRILHMQEYDATLKLLLQGSARLTVRELTGTAVAQWLNVELPNVRNLRLDLLGETVDGGLIHLELQSSNDAAMPLRMAEYCLGIFRLFGQLPQQVVLYVGERPLQMESALRGPGLSFDYRLVDIAS
jgi:hypothetical protein